MRISDWSSDVCSFRSIGGAAGGTVTVPGGGTLDLGKLDAAAKKMEETTKKMQSGEVKPIAPDALQAMLPASIAGWNRTEISSRGGAAGGLGGSNAELGRAACRERVCQYW